MYYIRSIAFLVGLGVLGLVWGNNLYACDVCGCSATGQFRGLLKEVPDNQIGINCYQSVFETTHPPNLFGEPAHETTRETFRFVNVNANYRIGHRFSLQAQVPFGFFKQTGYNTRQSGLGDVVLSVNYFALDELIGASANSIIVIAGAGIKLPTGKNDALQNDETLNPNLQLGTGSTDFLFFTQSTLRLGSSGFNAEMSYRINTENEHDYQFGNMFNVAARYFYNIQGDKFSHTPYLGVAYEHSQQNTSFGDRLSITGGYLLLLEAGYEFWLGNINCGISFMAPVRQELSDGLVANKAQFSTKLTYFF